MNLALFFLLKRFFYRIFEFLRHWYVKSGRRYSNFVINQLEKLDYYIAWRITLKHLFEPLYKDYSFIGYLMGFLFRALRLILGGVFYAAIFFAAIAGYLIWLFIPVYFVVKIIV